MKKRIAINSLLVFVSLVIGLLISEAIVRLLYKNLPVENWSNKVFCRNAKFNYRFMIPNSVEYIYSEDLPSIEVRANSNGYRDSDWKAKKGKKLMVIGDSFGWGWRCRSEKSMVHQIDSILGDEWCTYNLCIPGDDLYKMYSRFKYFQNLIKPDHVLIINYVNDFYNIPSQSAKLKKYAHLWKCFDEHVSCSEQKARSIRDYLNDYSYLYRFLNRMRATGGISLSSKKKRAAMLKLGFEKDCSLLTSPLKIDSAFDFYKSLLRDMSLNTKITIVNIPASYQVNPAKLAKVSKVLPQITGHEHAVSHAFQSKLIGLPNIHYVELLDSFCEHNKKGSLYFDIDSHLNERGQMLTGKLLADKLKRILSQ